MFPNFFEAGNHLLCFGKRDPWIISSMKQQ